MYENSRWCLVDESFQETSSSRLTLVSLEDYYPLESFPKARKYLYFPWSDHVFFPLPSLLLVNESFVAFKNSHFLIELNLDNFEKHFSVSPSLYLRLLLCHLRTWFRENPLWYFNFVFPSVTQYWPLISFSGIPFFSNALLKQGKVLSCLASQGEMLKEFQGTSQFVTQVIERMSKLRMFLRGIISSLSLLSGNPFSLHPRWKTLGKIMTKKPGR